MPDPPLSSVAGYDHTSSVTVPTALGLATMLVFGAIQDSVRYAASISLNDMLLAITTVGLVSYCT